MTDATANGIHEGSAQRPEARQDSRLDWWRATRFGMFIHWGLYAITAGTWKAQAIPGIGEWIMHGAYIPVAEYEQLAQQFNPTSFDAAARVAGERCCWNRRSARRWRLPTTRGVN